MSKNRNPKKVLEKLVFFAVGNKWSDRFFKKINFVIVKNIYF